MIINQFWSKFVINSPKTIKTEKGNKVENFKVDRRLGLWY